ncbi:MAG: CapA family protein [Calditrichaceae bacterium]
MLNFLFWAMSVLCILFNPVFSQVNETDSSEIVLYFTGDVSLVNHFEQHVGDRLDYPFNKLTALSEADIFMINLESPFTVRGNPVEKQFTFRALPKYAGMLKESGVDIVTLANNHMYDYGDTGIFDTIGLLDSVGIKHVGAGRNLAEARQPVIFDIRGLKLAYLAYYGTGPHSDSHPATETNAGTAMRNLAYIKEDIAKIRDQVDYIIINFHWGLEKANYPEESEKYYARKSIDYGADLIVGHHPHVLQGVELYKGKVIAYSLGNFIFGGNSRTFETSAVLKVLISPAKKGKYHAQIMPIGIRLWQPYFLEGQDADDVIKQVKEYSSVFNQSIF